MFRKKLIIKLDGEEHVEQKNYDDKRAYTLKMHGLHVVRFWNDEILEKLNDVLEIIYNALNR